MVSRSGHEIGADRCAQGLWAPCRNTCRAGGKVFDGQKRPGVWLGLLTLPGTGATKTPARIKPRPGGRVVMQRTANPRTSVRFRPGPPVILSFRLRLMWKMAKVFAERGGLCYKAAANGSQVDFGPR